MSQRNESEKPRADDAIISAAARRGTRLAIAIVVLGITVIAGVLAVLAAASAGSVVQGAANRLAVLVLGSRAADSVRFVHVAAAAMDSADAGALPQHAWRVTHVTPEAGGGACVGLAIVPLPGEQLRDGMVGVRVEADETVESITPYQTGCRGAD